LDLIDTIVVVILETFRVVLLPRVAVAKRSTGANITTKTKSIFAQLVWPAGAGVGEWVYCQLTSTGSRLACSLRAVPPLPGAGVLIIPRRHGLW
jgi:hypothetical protein